MGVVKSIGIIFTQIALECFKEDIIGERVDSRPLVKLVLPPNSGRVILRKDLALVTHLCLLQPTTSFVDVKYASPHWNPRWFASAMR
jgi:hypothetical protein